MKPWIPPGLANRFIAGAGRLVAAAVLLAISLPAPALAAPANVAGMSYDEAQRRISVGLSGTVSVRTQRIKNPDRLVIDLSEARLPLGQPIPIVQPKSSRIRSIRMGQNSYVPPVVRLVVDLMPGFEPMVTINQSGGKLVITLANPRPPQGERDLESLPGFPAPRREPAPPSYPDVPLTASPAPQGTDSGLVTRLPAPAASPLPNPSSRTPVPAQPTAGTSPPRTAIPTPKPSWTPPPVPGWVPRPTPTPAPSERPAGMPPGTPLPGAPLPGAPLPGAPLPGAPVTRPSVSETPSAAPPVLPPAPPASSPTVIIPEDVRPATPPPPADPFSPRPVDPFAPTPRPSLPPQAAPPQAAPGQAEPESAAEANGDADGDASEATAAESVLPEERRPSHAFGSSFQLRWQQIETLEEYGGPAPSFAYPAGINGFDLEHWFLPNVGAGFDARILYYDLTVESVRQHRTDASMGTYLALRYPLLGFLEPSVRAGYMGRNVTVESESTGTTFPFSPVQTYYGPTLSGRLKVALLPGFGLDLHGKLLPSTQGALYPGFPSIHPLSGRGWGANLVTDILQGYVSLGYTTEQLASADGSFKQTFSGITLGTGFRY